MKNKTNKLASQTSPYLLQHSQNPVDWYPWGKEALDRAVEGDKLLIISIGYAACHWCHVMAHESFEDRKVADYMNENFVSIKVDREERPDIDKIYMDAVQLLTGSGGWPLNVIALPDGRPLYGGTYFPRENWLSVLSQVKSYYSQNKQKAYEQASSLTEGISKTNDIIAPVVGESVSIDDLDAIYRHIIMSSDVLKGGQMGAPKFPMPTSLRFLLHYAYLTGNGEAEDYVNTTLEKMALGGIYDQIGGGFARYSVDSHWKVPHFEKMLYDNAQLLSLYSEAFQKTGRPLYERIIRETADFILREFTSPDHVFNSSLDADSEGEEGKYYTWTDEELNSILLEESEKFKHFYNISHKGNWEKGRNILFITDPLDEPESLKRLKGLVLKVRSKRIRPALDNKILAGWNGLMIKGYIDAYRSLHEDSYLSSALLASEFILENMIDGDRLIRTGEKSGKSINAFLDDYAFIIEAFLALYETTFDEKWLRSAKSLTDYVLIHFSDRDSLFFFYNSDLDDRLIARKKELVDNVISSSNSQMAQNLYRLGHYFFNDSYLSRAVAMAEAVKENALTGSIYFGNWDILMALLVEKPWEVVIVGEHYQVLKEQLECEYLPSVFLSGGKKDGSLPFLKNRGVDGKDIIYVCRDRSCLKPVFSTKEALKQIRS